MGIATRMNGVPVRRATVKSDGNKKDESDFEESGQADDECQ